VCSKLNRHVQTKVAERGMNNLDDEETSLEKYCFFLIKDEMMYNDFGEI